MKRHRLTKITVKTRETILLSRSGGAAQELTVCPYCHNPINRVPAAADGGDYPADAERRTATLPPSPVNPTGGEQRPDDKYLAEGQSNANRRDNHENCQS